MNLKELKYEDYLKTEYWKELSEVIKKEADYKCQICNSDSNLNVHHRSYEYKGIPELEKKDLVCICDKCHSIYHVNQDYNGYIEDIAAEYFEKLEEKMSDNKKIITGFKELDNLLNIGSGEVLLLSGEALMYDDFIYNVYLKNIESSIFIGLRLSKASMMSKLLCIESGTNFMTSLRISEDDNWTKIGTISNKIINSSSRIFTEIYDLKDIEAIVSKYCSEKKLFFIDSLNYLLKSSWNNNEIEVLIKEIKKMAKKYNVSIIINYDFPTLLINKVRSRADRRPVQFDLELVCNFFTYVDEVLLFYRDDYYNSESEKFGITEVIVSKLNQVIELKYFKEIHKFGDFKIRLKNLD